MRLARVQRAGGEHVLFRLRHLFQFRNSLLVLRLGFGEVDVQPARFRGFVSDSLRTKLVLTREQPVVLRTRRVVSNPRDGVGFLLIERRELLGFLFFGRVGREYLRSFDVDFASRLRDILLRVEFDRVQLVNLAAGNEFRRQPFAFNLGFPLSQLRFKRVGAFFDFF